MNNNNDMKSKTISVVMCTYNGEKFIREQLDSILRQTLPADEIIIQDDCSTDNTYNILCEYQQNHSIIHVYRNSRNIGINPNFFNAISKATGDYIAIADQDDIWEDYKLELQVNSIGEKLLCGGRSVPFSTTNEEVRVDMRIPNYNLIRWLFIGSISGHTMLFSRQLLEKMPPATDISPLRFYDAILGMVAAAYDDIIYIEKTLVHHRRHISSVTLTKPTDNTMTLKNIYKNVIRTWKFHKKLKPKISKRLHVTHSFLNQIDSKEPILKDAKRMIELYTSKSLLDFLRLVIFCIQHYDCLFYTKVNKFAGIPRAIYFPISLSEYYRYLLNKQ